MKAIGLTPQLIGGLIIAEGLTLGVIASMSGLVLGVLVSWPAVEYGVDISSMVGGDSMELGGVTLDTTIHAVWNPRKLIGFTLTAMLLSVGAAIWPAWHTSRTPALTAMRGPDASH